jgi:polyisoprenyl-teichoic acid--peptidoglycan teichoic acid transferase
LLLFVGCALLGVAIGYVLTLVYRPQLLPAALRFGGPGSPTTVLLLGVDVVYSGDRRLGGDKKSFHGLSDTIMLARFDPPANEFSVLSIPRDTVCEIPGHGRQKINSANAIGGEQLVMRAVEGLTGVHCEHFLVLNVHGLVELVDAVGGITIKIPKKMHYQDRTAGLNINLEAGPQTLNGTEAMGFVRFRHDLLGDIGRVQRQELFIQAVMDKALSPAAFAKVPELIQIAKKHVKTDLDPALTLQIIEFVRSVPKEKQHMVMLPGDFSGTGDWLADEAGLRKVVSSMLGQTQIPGQRSDLTLTIENASASPGLARRLARYLSGLGYQIKATSPRSEIYTTPQPLSRIIAGRRNPQEASLLQADLRNHAEIVNASIGDIRTSLTLVAGDDLIPLVDADAAPDTNRQPGR